MDPDILKDLLLKVAGNILRERNCLFVRGELGVFSPPLVVWLYISKRFSSGSWSGARTVLTEINKVVLVPNGSLRESTISTNMGELRKAFGRMPLSFIEELYTRSVENIGKHFSGGSATRSHAFVLDGLIISCVKRRRRP